MALLTSYALWTTIVLGGERVEIWSDDLASDLSEWKQYEDLDIVTDSDCPTESSCLELDGKGSHVWRYASTEGYFELKITFDLVETKKPVPFSPFFFVLSLFSNILYPSF